MTQSIPERQRRTTRIVDRSFQLKYTAYIVGLTLAVALPLGALLVHESSEAMRMGDDAVSVGTSANDLTRSALEQTTLLNRRLEMEAMLKLADKPDQLAAVKTANEAERARIQAIAADVDAREQRLVAHRAAIARQRSVMLAGVSFALLALVLLVAAAGISFTHRVAGPIYRMRKLFQDVGDGRFAPIRPLRKDDELQGFFSDFSTMVERVRERQKQDLALLDAAVAKVEAAGVDAGSLGELRAARGAIEKTIEGE